MTRRNWPVVLVLFLTLIGSLSALMYLGLKHSDSPRSSGRGGTALSVTRLDGWDNHLIPPRASRSRNTSGIVTAHSPSRRAARVEPAPRTHKVMVTGSSAFSVWQTSSDLHAVEQCESGGNPQATNGKYEGVLQMDADFWATYGGLSYASSPLGASKYQQEVVGYAGYLARGWQPWTCARIVGIY